MHQPHCHFEEDTFFVTPDPEENPLIVIRFGEHPDNPRILAKRDEQTGRVVIDILTNEKARLVRSSFGNTETRIEIVESEEV